MKTQYFMLDTNMVSYIIKGKPIVVREHLNAVPISTICISVMTEAELLHGVAKKPNAKHLTLAVKEFLLRVEILPWESETANTYAQLRTTFEKEGKSLSAMDLLIAAHAVAVGAVLITSDLAFYNVAHHLTLQDWTKPID